MEWSALELSLKLATLTTLILVTIATPSAFYVSRTNRRGIFILEAMVSLPMVLPPTVLGFYLLLLLSSVKLAFTFTGLLIASLIYSFPFAFQPILSGFQMLDGRYLETAWVLGESKVQTFFRVALPLAKESIFTGLILAFTHTLGEFGVVLMIGGNIPNVSRTLSLSLYDQVESGQLESANHTALILLVFSVTALSAVRLMRQKSRRLLEDKTEGFRGNDEKLKI